MTVNFFFISDEDYLYDTEPFSQLNGESIEYMGLLQDDFIIALSNYRLFATQEDGFYSVSKGSVWSMRTAYATYTIIMSAQCGLIVHCACTRPCALWWLYNVNITTSYIHVYDP